MEKNYEKKTVKIEPIFKAGDIIFSPERPKPVEILGLDIEHQCYILPNMPEIYEGDIRLDFRHQTLFSKVSK